MNSSSLDIQFLGAQPEIVGQLCTGLVFQHVYENKTLVDQANVTYLRFSEVWHRIYFESGTVFWRSDQAPEQAVNSTLEHGLLLNDLSELLAISGNALLGIDYTSTASGNVEVRFNFERKVLRLSYDASVECTKINMLSKNSPEESDSQ